MGAEEPDGGFDVVNLSGEYGLCCEPVVDACNGIAPVDQTFRVGIAMTTPPTSTVDPDDQAGRGVRYIKIELEFVVLDGREREPQTLGGDSACFG